MRTFLFLIMIVASYTANASDDFLKLLIGQLSVQFSNDCQGILSTSDASKKLDEVLVAVLKNHKSSFPVGDQRHIDERLSSIVDPRFVLSAEGRLLLQRLALDKIDLQRLLFEPDAFQSVDASKFIKGNTGPDKLFREAIRLKKLGGGDRFL